MQQTLSNINHTHDTNEEDFRLAWLRLARTRNVGPRTFIELLNMFGSPQRALLELPKLARRGGEPAVPASVEATYSEMKQCRELGIHLLLACDEAYPSLLAELHDCPPVLFCKGNLELLKESKIGIVGGRNASTHGRSFTQKLACDLGKSSYVIVSGLARGIDAAAHYGGLAASGTIAVVASGVDVVYPRENQGLYDDIARNGLIISEYPLGQPPLAHYFPQRNRIISGLSSAVIVIEAAQNSGSLITARYALDQGREVLAVPGFPGDPRCSGSNSLIKSGAALVERAEDVVASIGFLPGGAKEQGGLHERASGAFDRCITDVDGIVRDDYRVCLLEKLSFVPITMEEIMADSDIPPALVNLAIIELELAGKIDRTYDNKFCLVMG